MCFITVNNPRTDIGNPVLMTDLQIHWHRICFNRLVHFNYRSCWPRPLTEILISWQFTSGPPTPPTTTPRIWLPRYHHFLIKSGIFLVNVEMSVISINTISINTFNLTRQPPSSSEYLKVTQALCLDACKSFPFHMHRGMKTCKLFFAETEQHNHVEHENNPVAGEFS